MAHFDYYHAALTGIGLLCILLTFGTPQWIVGIGKKLGVFTITEEQARLVTICAWIVGPPVWFLVEHVWFMPSGISPSDFKDSQDLAKEIWNAFAIVLAATWGVKKFW